MLDVLQQRGLPLLKPLLFVGAASGLLAATFGSLFPMPRVLYAMAKDKLILSFFTYVNPKRKTAEVATVVSGLAAAFLASLVDLQILIELVLMGTLLSYILVAFCVLVMRYTSLNHREKCSDYADVPEGVPLQRLDAEEGKEFVQHSTTISSEAVPLLEESTGSCWTCRRYKFHQSFVTALIVLTFAVEVLLSVLMVFWSRELLQRHWLPLSALAVLGLLWVVAITLLAGCQQSSPVSEGFQCPWVPFLPCLVSFFNIYLMASLKPLSWQFFTLWILLGLVSYCVCTTRQRLDGY